MFSCDGLTVCCAPSDIPPISSEGSKQRRKTWLEEPSPWRTAKVVFILGPAAFSLGFGLDVYVPAIPHVMKEFDTTQRRIQLTFGLFMLFTGLGQLIFGPLSDHFGRRIIAILSGLFYIFGSALCGIATDVDFLIISRVVESIGKTTHSHTIVHTHKKKRFMWFDGERVRSDKRSISW